jgi:toxin ParE1/3/4
MARLIWTEPAVSDLESIVDYIALDKPGAARRYAQIVFAAVERLARFPSSGSVPPEIPDLPYRQVIVPPCRVFYRFRNKTVFILHVMRFERFLRDDLLEEREKNN